MCPIISAKITKNRPHWTTVPASCNDVMQTIIMRNSRYGKTNRVAFLVRKYVRTPKNSRNYHLLLIDISALTSTSLLSLQASSLLRPPFEDVPVASLPSRLSQLHDAFLHQSGCVDDEGGQHFRLVLTSRRPRRWLVQHCLR